MLFIQLPSLIMLLIVCDMWKAIWFMSFPLVEFFGGKPVKSNSAFCQANGFFLAVGTEACDIAILMIAMHTALYIFRPGHAECGLYPYRKQAYVAMAVLPLAMASLAFAGGSGYVNRGGYCYLPMRPDVYRLALSWVPRYIIFIFILVIYASLYIYVRMLMRKYGKASGLSMPRHSIFTSFDRWDEVDEWQKTPQAPPIAYHALTSSAPTLQSESADPAERPCGSHKSATSNINDENYAKIYGSFYGRCPNGINTKRPPLASSPFSSAERSSPFSISPESATQTALPHLAYIPNSVDPESPTTIAVNPSSPLWNNRSLTTTANTTAKPLHRMLYLAARSRTIFSFRDEFLHTQSRKSSISSGPTPSLNTTGMTETRDKISKQLRFLFVYPLVYTIMWGIPFIAHILSYSDEFSAVEGYPFPLLVFTLISLTGQGAVDCWLFASRERPWKHARESFWGSLACKLKIRRTGNGNPSRGVGRSRDEMVVAARHARMRRDEEIAARRQEMRRSVSESRGRERHKEWWEVGVGARWSQMPSTKFRRRPSDASS